MSFGDFMGLSALMIGIIAVSAILMEGYKRRLAFKERQLELTASQTAEKAAQYAAHTERLETRVRVLERIATDKGVDLAAAIEDLRDPAVN